MKITLKYGKYYLDDKLIFLDDYENYRTFFHWAGSTKRHFISGLETALEEQRIETNMIDLRKKINYYKKWTITKTNKNTWEIN